MRNRLFLVSALLFCCCCVLSARITPTRLTTDLVEHTDRTYSGNQTPFVSSSRPSFAWVVEGGAQKMYRIVLKRGDGELVWDSGRVASKQSCGIMCPVNLQAASSYVWDVTVWSAFGANSTASKSFWTAGELDREWSAYPLDSSVQAPVSLLTKAPGVYLADFGRDAFGQVSFKAFCPDSCTAVLHLGEKLGSDGRIDRNPGGSIRYACYRIPLCAAQNDCTVQLRRDPRNASHYGKPNPGNEPPIMMPDYIGEVYPFRYVEIEFPCEATLQQVERTVVNYPFNDGEASFTSSDSLLNAVWDLCKYSIKATSFCGYYVDGDRERIPYEADALINQISHYCTDREYTMARRTLDYLIFHPTWPTEWNLQIPIIAWRDYLYTGDSRLLERRYEDIVAKAMIPLRDSRGLITTKGVDTKAVQEAIHYHRPERFRDIVDWPPVGRFGAPGEDDGFVFCQFNTVVNAYHYEALRKLERIALALGKKQDAGRFASLAGETRASLLELCYDPADGAFRDGIGTDHKALHSTLFALDFGLVPTEDVSKTLEFIHSKGMVCSVYAAQMLLEGLYESGDSQYALSLLTGREGRCWKAMMDEGSTITLEAWSSRYKSNLDWNHAWGAAPANIIPRYILGVEPLEPGCSVVRVRPQPGGLEFVEGTVPTLRGPVHVRAERRRNGTYKVRVDAPAGIEIRYR